MRATVPAKTTVRPEDSAQMIRYTGNFTLTCNATINLTGVYFDRSPDPPGNGNWTLTSQSVTGSPI